MQLYFLMEGKKIHNVFESRIFSKTKEGKD